MKLTPEAMGGDELAVASWPPRDEPTGLRSRHITLGDAILRHPCPGRETLGGAGRWGTSVTRSSCSNCTMHVNPQRPLLLRCKSILDRD